MNPFDLLGVPEKAWQDLATLKSIYQNRSHTLHPDSDRSGSPITHKHFAELNQAYQVILSPGRRLQRLLELRFGQAFTLKGAIPVPLLDMFAHVGATLKLADILIMKKTKTTTALAQAVMARQLVDVQQSLGKAARCVGDALQGAEQRLHEIDELLDSGAKDALDVGSSLCRELIYLEKWHGQIQARFHSLI